MPERTFFPASILRELPNLKLLLTMGSRNAAVDISAAAQQGIRVVGTNPRTNDVSGYDATNEMTWALILALAKWVAVNDSALKRDVRAW